MPSLAKLHEQALSKYSSVKRHLDTHKETLQTGVMRLVGAAEAAAGGGVAAAFDHYFGDGTGAPAMVGPVPLVAATALAGTAVAILAGKDEYGVHLANFFSGMGAASAYAETMTVLKALPAAA